MQRLSRGFPAPFAEGADAAKAAAATRELGKLLLEVASRFAIEGVEGGVDLILDGRLAGFDGKRLPTPTQLALAIRQALSDRAGSPHRRVPAALAAPDIAHDAESRARVKARVEAFVASARAGQAGEAEAAGDRARALAEKVAQRFDPPQDADALMERLVRNRTPHSAAR